MARTVEQEERMLSEHGLEQVVRLARAQQLGIPGEDLPDGLGVTEHHQRRSRGNPERERSADRKSTRLNSSHLVISYAVFCLKKKKTSTPATKCAAHRRATTCIRRTPSRARWPGRTLRPTSSSARPHPSRIERVDCPYEHNSG